jgi:hypothetical protein
MKFVAIALFACIAAAVAGPIEVSDNNIGNIVTVGLSANAVLSNQVDQTIVNVILALLNQQAAVVATDGAAPAAAPALPEITPEMIEKVKSFLTSA